MFEIGQKVVCVYKESDWLNREAEILPVKGDIYKVRSVIVVNGHVGIRLCEIVNNPDPVECAYTAKAFRPTDDTFGHAIEASINETIHEETLAESN